MEENKILLKKQFYAIDTLLHQYLHKYMRLVDLPLQYEDLKHFHSSIPCNDENDQPTLWETVMYTEWEFKELNEKLTLIYSILKSAGNTTYSDHLKIARIDYCSFGNSQPFRIKILNQINDNYDYFYVKIADASRVYGLELEDVLSPNKINYLIHKDTIIEEHIVGIPGDDFAKNHLQQPGHNEVRLAKEFIKFNERCMARLLGDMRAYNFVIDMTPDFDQIQYRIRAIDFDQQSYEGRKNIYLPQFYKENNAYVQLAIQHMTVETTKQYQTEERALMGKRALFSKYQLKDLLDVMNKQELAPKSHINQLKNELAEHHHESRFLQCQTMGQILKRNLKTMYQAV